MITIIAILILSQAETTSKDPFPGTARAIMWVESKGDPNATGDGGRSIGCYQIGRPYWQDATGYLGVSWPYEDARDPVKALAAVRAYTEHWAKVHRLPWTPETIARVHNGGPRGPFRKSTVQYWQRVRAVMEQK